MFNCSLIMLAFLILLVIHVCFIFYAYLDRCLLSDTVSINYNFVVFHSLLFYYFPPFFPFVICLDYRPFWLVFILANFWFFPTAHFVLNFLEQFLVKLMGNNCQIHTQPCHEIFNHFKIFLMSRWSMAIDDIGLDIGSFPTPISESE